MSETDQDAIVGKLVRERSEASKELALARAYFQSSALVLRALSTALTMQGLTDLSTKQSAEELLAKVDVDKLKEHIRSARQASEALSRAETSLEELGIK